MTMTNKVRINFGLTSILCVLLVLCIAVPASAATYSKVYGTTQDRIRVRESASSSANTIDNLVKNRCVYIVQSKVSSGVTWVEVTYRTHEGGTGSGWVAQNDGKNTFVKVLSATQAKSLYNVSDGNLPSKPAGAWTQKERDAARSSGSSSGSSNSSVSSATVKAAQQKLKNLGIYSGEVTGNIGEKTTAAIKEFQKRNNLTVDGVLGPSTLQKLNVASSSSSSSSSNDASTDTIKDVQAKLKNMGIYSGEVTGNVGDKTTAAIKEFQKRYNLTVDGVAGPATVAKLNQVYSNSTTVKVSSSSKTGLGLGSSGTAVSQLQTNLTTLGYYWAEITGNFGAKTETAVKAFQKAYGLPQDGVAGTSTLNAISTAVAKKGGSSSSSSSSGGLVTSGILQLNSTGTNVSALQTSLKALGFYSGEITGHYGEKTRDAVRAYQSKNGLTADGIAGPSTLKAIAASAKNVSVSTASSSKATSSTTLTQGSTGAAVTTLQNNLYTLGYYNGDITGHYGSRTAAAVKAYQKARGLTQTGTASPDLQKAIANLTGTGSTAVYTGSTAISLREGDSGTQVTALQSALNKLNYYYGEITGHYGSLTTKAVKRFQDDNDITVDGVAGPKTIALINSKAGSSITPTSNTSSSSSSISTGTTTSALISYGRITRNNVTLRSSASVNSKGKVSLKTGAVFKISEKVTTGGYTWYKISVEQGGTRYSGYVRSDMTTIISRAEYNSSSGSTSSSGDDDDSVEGIITVTANYVAVRIGPSMDYDIKYRADKGDIYSYVDVESGWYKLSDGNYINGAYCTASTSGSTSYDYSGTETYRYGDTASMVTTIQEWLTMLNYYSGTITGHYGDATVAAVKSFQSDNGLTDDGVAGPKTIGALQQKIASRESSSYSVANTVYNVSWFDAQKISGLFKTMRFEAGRTGTLTDLNTGITIGIKIQSTGNHIDAEPLTDKDTAKFCAIYGVSNASNITSSKHYARRPMLMTLNSYQFVCSMYGVPHGASTINDNNYPGQFCLHFLHSRTSGTNKEDTSKNGHQDMINKAIEDVKKQKTGIKVKVIPTESFP